ncbi:Uncharacterised protein [Serratia fonticola]|nr:Uncharacterised protein [Serratia fonticola]
MLGSQHCHACQSCLATCGLPASQIWTTSLGLHNLFIVLQEARELGQAYGRI